MSSHEAFKAYLFPMKLAESLECTNCERKGRDDDAWHILLECPAFQLYQEDVRTTLQKMGEQFLTQDSLIPIILKSSDGWDQVAAFVTLAMRCKMEIPWEWQRQPIAAANQYPMLGCAIPPRLPSATQQWKKMIQAGLLQRHMAAINT